MKRILPFVALFAPLPACAEKAPDAAMAQASAQRAAPRPPAARRPAGASPISLTATGTPQIVLPATAMSCARQRASDQPDMPASAYRRADGSVVLLATNRQSYVADGPSLDRVSRRSCANAMKLGNDGDPSKFNDQQWMMGVIPLSRTTFIAAVHNEYHGDYHGSTNCRPAQKRNADGSGNKLCWYASSTLAVSKDGGQTFQAPPAPNNILAAPSQRYVPGTDRVSTSTPKILRNGNYLYAMVSFSDRNRAVRIQQCLLRADVSKPFDWRAYDGRGFTMKMDSPYANTGRRDCVGVLPGNVFAVKYVPAKKLYIAVRGARDGADYVTSPDLVTWSRPTRFYNSPDGGRAPEGAAHSDWYFSLLDPSSSSASFDTIEGNPYLYFARYHPRAKYGRAAADVMRVKLRLR